MKRFHVHLGVADIDASVAFYSRLFGAAPTVRQPDYAKWMLDDPRVNFAISTRTGTTGLDHLGLQADSASELQDIAACFDSADRNSAVAQPAAECCYVRSDKHWVRDPQGLAWEAFHTLEAIPVFGGDHRITTPEKPCCDETATGAVSIVPLRIGKRAP